MEMVQTGWWLNYTHNWGKSRKQAQIQSTRSDLTNTLAKQNNIHVKQFAHGKKPEKYFRLPRWTFPRTSRAQSTPPIKRVFVCTRISKFPWNHSLAYLILFICTSSSIMEVMSEASKRWIAKSMFCRSFEFIRCAISWFKSMDRPSN